MLLAIDTATRIMSIALHDGDNLIAEQSWRGSQRHTVELAPAIHSIMATCEVERSQLTALGVSIGPGSYTGLRIGVALAKGMAAAAGLPLVGVTSLQTLAMGQPYFRSGVGLITVVQAGRGRLIVQSFHWHHDRWMERTEHRLMTWDELLQTIDGPAFITGEVDPKGKEAIHAAPNADQITIASPANRMRRAGYLAEYAWEQLREAGDDRSAFAAERVLPVYIQARKTSEKQHES